MKIFLTSFWVFILPLVFSSCATRKSQQTTAAVQLQKPKKQTFSLRNGIPILFVACDNSLLQPEQKGCQPEGARQGDLHFYELDGKNPGTGNFEFSGAVLTRAELLGVPKGKSGQRICADVLGQIQSGADNMVLLDNENQVVNEAGSQLQCQVDLNIRLAGETTVSVTPIGVAWELPMGVLRFQKKLMSFNPLVGRDPKELRIKTNVSLLGPLGVSKINAYENEVLYFLLDLNHKLQPNWFQVEGCLKNSRAFGQLDLQHHAYCQLPKDPYRKCLGSRITAYKADKRCDGKLPNVSEAVDFCFKDQVLLNEKGDKSDYFYANPWRLEMFKEVFLVSSGLKDFDVEKENEIVSKFYVELEKDRPRRILDSYPQWNKNQPRYIELWQKQLAGAAKLPSRPAVCAEKPDNIGESLD